MSAELERYGLGSFPWERLPDETAKQYAAFLAYRDLGRQRTLRRAALVYYEIPEGEFDPGSGKIRTFERWSAQNRWVARAEQYDEYLQAAADEDALQAVIAMKTRHAAIATAAQGKVIAALNAMDLSKVPALQLIQIYDITTRNERLARGVPATVEAIVAADNSPQGETVADEQLEAKLASWRMARDPANTIELGEPGSDDTED